MWILINGLALFIFTLGVQILLWSVLRIKQNVKGVSLFFLPVFGIWLVFALTDYDAGLFRLQNIAQKINALVLAVALSVSYLLNILCLKSLDPASIILQKVQKAGAAGISRKELLDSLESDQMILKQLESLVCSGKIEFTRDRYHLPAESKSSLTQLIRKKII